MNIVVVGTGAIGIWLGTRLTVAGHQVTALARGETLQALQQHGWRLKDGAEVIQVGAVASDSAADLGSQDLIIIAVKGPSLVEVATDVHQMCHLSTVLLPIINGIPWWFLPSMRGFKNEPPLQSIDPAGQLIDKLGLESVLGTVVYTAAFTPERGVSEISRPAPLIIGEPLTLNSPRLDRIAGLFNDAGIETVPSADIQRTVWTKLLLNLILNPLSALTRSTTRQIASEPLNAPLISQIYEEGLNLGEALGLNLEPDLDNLLNRMREYKD